MGNIIYLNGCANTYMCARNNANDRFNNAWQCEIIRGGWKNDGSKYRRLIAKLAAQTHRISANECAIIVKGRDDARKDQEEEEEEEETTIAQRYLRVFRYEYSIVTRFRVGDRTLKKKRIRNGNVTHIARPWSSTREMLYTARNESRNCWNIIICCNIAT